MLTGGDDEGAKEESTVKVEEPKKDTDKELANHIKVNE